LGAERLALGLRRQLAVDEQVAGLDEVGVLRQLLYRVATVAQDAFFTVEVRDRARGRAGDHVPAVERDVAGFLAKRSDVDRVFVFGAHDHGQRGLFSSREDELGTNFLGHVGLLRYLAALETIPELFPRRTPRASRTARFSSGYS